MCFIDSAYVNEPTKRRYTTRFASTFSRGAVIYRSRTQSINALSLTEKEIVTDVTYAKTASLLRYMLWYLGFPQEYPTPIFEDNDHTIYIVNSIIATERYCHIYVWFFAIQLWKEDGYIIMHHIPGIINHVYDITKPLGWVLYSGNVGYLMWCYNISFRSLINSY